MVNRGKIVKSKLAELGIKIKSLASKLEKSEGYLYQLLDREDLQWEIIRKIGSEIRYDFRRDFPDMPFLDEYPVLDSEADSWEEKLEIYKSEAVRWKNKYFTLLEDVSAHYNKANEKN